MTIPNFGNRLNIFFIQRSPPSRGDKDDLWFDPADGTHYIHDGAGWVVRPTAGPPAATYISADPGNLIVEGTDGLLFATVGALSDWISADVGNRLGQGTDQLFFVPPVAVDPATLVSGDAGNRLAQGTDDGLFVPPVDPVDPANLISGDADNRVVQGTDDGLFVPPLPTALFAPRATVAAPSISTDLDGNAHSCVVDQAVTSWAAPLPAGGNANAFAYHCRVEFLPPGAGGPFAVTIPAGWHALSPLKAISLSAGDNPVVVSLTTLSDGTVCYDARQDA